MQAGDRGFTDVLTMTFPTDKAVEASAPVPTTASSPT